MAPRLTLKILKDAGKGNMGYPIEAGSPPVSRKIIKDELQGLRKELPSSIAYYAERGNGFIGKNKRLDKYLKGERTLLEARSRVRGASSVVQVYQNANRLFSKESKVYHCDFFRLLYFPPDHFLSLFRKSKPAVNVRVVGEVFLNANVSRDNGMQLKSTEMFRQKSKIDGYGKKRDMTKLKKTHSLFAGDSPNIPKHYAYLRQSLKRFLNKCFIKEWIKLNGDEAVCEHIKYLKTTEVQQTNCSQDSGNIWKFLDSEGRTKQGIAKDGFYLYQVLIFPDVHTKHEFHANVIRSVEAVANLKWETFLKANARNKSWVQEVNERVKTSSLNAYLARDQVPRMVKRE